VELRHLRYFVAVAQELHFGRAAERLFMAQPPLSQQIQQLEKELGVDLFKRTSRRVELTAAGTVFLEDARAILAHAEVAVLRAQAAGRGESGRFVVGFVGSALYSVLPDILREFSALFPDVELVLQEMLGHEQGRALRERRIHVGFARLPPSEPGVQVEVLVREPLLAAVPAKNPLAYRDSIRLSELAGEPFIIFPRSPESGYSQFLLNICRSAGFSPRIVQEVGETQTAIGLVAAGIGVALVPAAVENLRRSGMAYVPLEEPAPRVDLTIAFAESESSPVLPHFLEIARRIGKTGTPKLEFRADQTPASN